MREILFKAKRTDNGEWVEGYYLRAGTHWHKKGIHDDWIVVDAIQNGGFLTLLKRYAVDPETICQYTGLTDSNGVKVFEGDILKFTDEFNGHEWTGRMEFGNPNAGYTWGWQLVYVSGEEANVDTLCWFDMEESGAYSEVIGNIHDKED